jgi:hypothetical protein
VTVPATTVYVTVTSVASVCPGSSSTLVTPPAQVSTTSQVSRVSTAAAGRVTGAIEMALAAGFVAAAML